MSTHLILGGARSGKSGFAERLARERGLPTSVIVTAEALDVEMAERIGRHRNDRPSQWRTVEAPLALVAALAVEAAPERCVIVDCLTLWLTNLMVGSDPEEKAYEDTLMRVKQERSALIELIPQLRGTTLIVANEVGLGLVPDTPLGRIFRDEAGRLNQAVASACSQVTFIAAGLPLRLKG
jgi:adenosylcobinamide kinase / adenosylcobinamide-phosphate guanylyltransferase